MKYILGFVVAMITLTALAQSPKLYITSHCDAKQCIERTYKEGHWIQLEKNIPVYDEITHAMDLKANVYFDDVNLVTEDGYVGYDFKWVFTSDAQERVKSLDNESLMVNINFRTLFTTIEINCQDNTIRGRKTFLISAPHNLIYPINEDWTPVDKHGAGSIVFNHVLNKICQK